MRLPLKIGAIVLAPILTAALVIFIFFPGLFTYIKVKFKYENIDRTIPTFDLVWIPDDFEEYSGSDITLLAPADMKDVSTKMPYGTKYKSSTTKYQKGKQTVMIIDQNDIYDRIGYDPWDNEKYNKKDYRHFFESIDHDFPSILDNSLLWFEKDELNAKMCLHLRSNDLLVYKELAKNKNDAWNLEDTWKYKGDGFTCYVCHSFGDATTKEMWTCTIYPDYNPYRHISVWIRGTDDTTAKQIASSIKLK